MISIWGTPWKQPGKWFVSPYNYVEEVKSTITLPKKVLIHDATLRDGEQAPGVVFRKDEKVRIALLLDEIGVHRIEAGMPVVSPEDKEAVKTVVREVTNAKVMSFGRLRKEDVDAAIECDASGIVMELPSLKERIYRILRWSMDEATQKVTEHVEYAKEHGLYTVFFLIDSTRADFDTLQNLITAAKQGKVDAITLADTNGCVIPIGFAYFVKKVKEFANIPIEVHCHNHLGLATANALAGVASGAEVVHTNVNGLNFMTPLAEAVIDLLLLLGINTGIKTDKLYELSKMVEKFSGVLIEPLKPLVGELSFSTEVGIAVEVQYKDPEFAREYSLINPALIGRKPQIVLGKKSGKYSILKKLEEKGLSATPEEVAALLNEVKQLSIHKKGAVTDEEFEQLVKTVLFK